MEVLNMYFSIKNSIRFDFQIYVDIYHQYKFLVYHKNKYIYKELLIIF